MLRSQYLWLVTLFIYNVYGAIDPNCKYSQEIKPKETYEMTSPAYPEKLYTSKTCQWSLYGSTRIRIICNQFEVAKSPNCTTASLDVYSGPDSLPMKYCGSGRFSKESDGNEMIVLLNTIQNRQGVRFKCTLEAVDEDKCRCGFKNPGQAKKSKIVGGEETGINEYPMMAGVINKILERVMCGSTIISNRYVVTAAHCVKNLAPEKIAIIVGKHDFEKRDETSATIHSVSKIQTHPGYILQKQDYDISVITVSDVILFSNKVSPACLPFQHYQDSFGGSFVDVLGWGTLDFGGEQSPTLQKATLSVTNFDTCKIYYPQLEYRQICTYTEGSDACQFDSGGPVLWQNPTTRRLVLVGIISYGNGCATSVPGVHTRVGQFLEWIVQVTPGAAYCQAE